VQRVEHARAGAVNLREFFVGKWMMGHG
jgi:hypothetical protein